MIEWVQLLAGGLLLYLGAEWFVGGASALALALRVPQLIVGLTIVAYGTSAPEVIVGIQAASSAHGDVALGNVIGSNIANIGLILGVAAVVTPARVHGALRGRELPMLVASTLAVPLVLLDASIHRWEGGGLVLVAVAYTIWMIRAARTASELATATASTSATGDAASASAGAIRPRSVGRAVTAAALGLVVLLLGGNLFIEGAVSVARLLNVSDRIVGLTIVAVGTSLPELVTSVVAARRGHSDLAVGNVVGSNIFNVFLCLGTAAIAGTVSAQLQTLLFDFAGLFVMTGLAVVLIRKERTISRKEGAIAIVLYCSFTALTILRG